MSRAFLLCTTAVLLGLAGCASEADYVAVFNEQRAAWRELTEVLATVRDEKSMSEAKATLEDRLDKFEQIAAKARALPKPSQDIQLKLKEDAPKLQRAIENAQYEVRRVKGLPGGTAFLKQFETKSPGLFSAVQP